MSINLVHHLVHGASPTPSTTVVNMTPDQTSIPGSNVLQSLSNGLGAWALIAAMAGVVIGAVTWAFGHYSQNYQMAFNGRRGVLISGVAAVLIGGAPMLVNKLVVMGQGLH